MPVCKFFGAMRLPPYDGEMLVKGLCGAAAAAVCFAVGLNDAVDPFRLFHGLSQVVAVVVVVVVVVAAAAAAAEAAAAAAAAAAAVALTLTLTRCDSSVA